MKIFRLLLVCILVLWCGVAAARDESKHPGACNLCTTYEDTLCPLRGYWEETAVKGRAAVINGQSPGDPSYMMILTYWNRNDKKNWFPDERVVRLKEVNVNVMLRPQGDKLSQDKSDCYRLRNIATIWYGLDKNGDPVSVRELKATGSEMIMTVENMFENWVEVWNSPENPAAARVIDEMAFKHQPFSAPGFRLTFEPEWRHYVRGDTLAEGT